MNNDKRLKNLTKLISTIYIFFLPGYFLFKPEFSKFRFNILPYQALKFYYYYIIYLNSINEICDYSSDVTLIRFGLTASRLGITISRTPSLHFALIASPLAESGRLKRR